MTCKDCGNCHRIYGVAGADCGCTAKSDGKITFEVSQDDDIHFYGESKNEPCKDFTKRTEQFIITKHYNDGKTTAQLSEVCESDTSNEQFDSYCNSVGIGCDYEDVKEWCDENLLNLEDIEVLAFGEIVDISAYV